MVIANDTNALAATDPEMTAVIGQELDRQRRHLELIASENFASPAVMQAQASVLTNKYAEGLPGKRYYGGCQHVDRAEEIAIDRAKRLFGAEHANVQPHSGAQANFAVFLACLEPGDAILGMSLDQGGHLTHGSPVNVSGKWFTNLFYGTGPDGRIDYDSLRRPAHEKRPKLIIAGASAYPRIIDFDAFAEIAGEVGAYLLVDMAHIAGLVAGGQHPSPVGRADFVTTTTHKTLRGPRGGLILGSADWAKRLDSAVFPGSQGGPLMHVIAAKGVAFREALEPSFFGYQEQVVANARAMADGLLSEGMKLISGGTDNHLVLVDLSDTEVTGKDAEQLLDSVGITANKNSIPADPRKPWITSGLRLGSPAGTTRGLGLDEFRELGRMIAMVCKAPQDENILASTRARVAEMCDGHPLYPDL